MVDLILGISMMLKGIVQGRQICEVMLFNIKL